MMPRRLVILGSSLTALAVARDAQAHGIEPVVVDRVRGIAFTSRWVEPVLTNGNMSAALAMVLRYGAADSALVATSDDWLRFVAVRRATLAEAFTKILHPHQATLESFLVKAQFHRWCACHGLPTPRAWSPDRSPRPAGLEFPLLIRPSQMVHVSPRRDLPKAVEVHSEAELGDWLERYERSGAAPLVSESLLPRRLRQYSVPFARSGRLMLSFVAEKLRPSARRCAQGSFVAVVDNDEVERLGRQAAEQADYFGIGEAEILHCEQTGRNYIVEINARPWLQYSLAKAVGRDFLGLMLGTAGAKDVPDAAALRRVAWVNLRDDRNAREGLPAWAYLRSLLGCVHAVLDWRDPVPFLCMARQTAHRAVRRLLRILRRRPRAAPQALVSGRIDGAP